MDIFKGQNLLAFSDRLKTDEDCKKYLAEISGKMGLSVLNVGIKELLKQERITRAPAMCIRIKNLSHQIRCFTR